MPVALSSEGIIFQVAFVSGTWLSVGDTWMTDLDREDPDLWGLVPGRTFIFFTALPDRVHSQRMRCNRSFYLAKESFLHEDDCQS